MKLLSWNCQGSGNPKTVRALRKLIATTSPDIIFLMETKQISKNPHFLSHFMDMYNCKIVDCTTTGGGKAGGLALLWNNCNIDLNIKNYDFNYIDLLINSNNTN
jgi:exonuclease III